jgi:GT2 family glycosyltransferase
MTQSPAPDRAQPDLPEVSVIIVNWNTRALLADCIRSIKAQTTARHEIIVIDNCSTDGSADMVAATFPDVVLIANPDNRGFAAANNQGLAVARGTHLLLLNPDTIILDHAIDKSLAWLARHPGVGCMGCQVLEGPDVIQRTGFSDPGPLNQAIVELGLTRLDRFPLFARPFYSRWDRKSEKVVDVVSGMFMLVPRAVYEKVGPLDPAFFIYAEEADWCRRIRKAGFSCVFAPVAQIIHLDGGSKSTAQIKSRMYVQKQKSHLIYLRKHESPLGLALVKSAVVLSALLRLAVFSALTLIRPSDTSRARIRLARAALAFQLLGKEPQR